jgi:hypothetical protein
VPIGTRSKGKGISEKGKGISEKGKGISEKGKGIKQVSESCLSQISDIFLRFYELFLSSNEQS